MAYNGAGVFERPVADYASGNTISSSDMNTEMDGMATGLSTAITKDGQTTVTANLPMANFKHTGVGNATARTHYAAAGQVADGSLTYGGVAGGTADALTIAPSPAITAYALGQRFSFIVGASPNTTAVTLNINSVGAGSVVWPDGTALVAGDLPADAGVEVMVVDISTPTAPVFHVQTETRAPGSAPISTTSATLTSTDAGASAGPTLTLDRNSASPAAADDLGEIKFTGRDSGAGTDVYTRIYAEAVDPTAASEDGRLGIETKIAGTAADRVFVGHGLYTAGATGGDKGADTVNAEEIYVAGVRVKPWPILATLTASTSASLDFTATNSTLYAGYFCLFENIRPATDNAAFVWRVSIDGGSSYISTGSYYEARVIGGGATAVTTGGTTSSTTVILTVGQSNSSAGYAYSGDGVVSIGGATANATKIRASGSYVNTAPATVFCVVTGSNTTTSQVDAFQFFMSNGNITSGTIRVYGIPK